MLIKNVHTLTIYLYWSWNVVYFIQYCEIEGMTQSRINEKNKISQWECKWVFVCLVYVQYNIFSAFIVGKRNKKRHDDKPLAYALQYTVQSSSPVLNA